MGMLTDTDGPSTVKLTVRGRSPSSAPLSLALPLRFLLHGSALVATVPDIHLPISNLEAYQVLGSAFLAQNIEKRTCIPGIYFLYRTLHTSVPLA
jgi:hypothetical protein